MVVDKLEGADAPTLTQKLAAFSSTHGAPTAIPLAKTTLEPEEEVIQGRIKFILASYPIVIFMKVGYLLFTRLNAPLCSPEGHPPPSLFTRGQHKHHNVASVAGLSKP